MSSQVFYRKWRAQTLSELVGQPHVTQTLLNALKNGNISHAYLFCGSRGTGKTSTARILAKAINCLNNNGRGEPCNKCDMCQAVTEDRAMDVIEIDAASNRGIDDIRDLREKVNYAPTQARRKVYIIDEFHMLSKDASNALLKTLEEPPPHVVFVLATTESHKVLPTILSRCQHFDFHRLSRADMVGKLSLVCGAEKINIDPQSLNLIARSSTGSMRDAYNLLEQITSYYGSDIKFTQLQAMLGITGDIRAKEIARYIINNDIATGMATLNNINNDGLDLRQFNRELVEYLRQLLLIKTGAVESVDLTAEDIAELKMLAEKSNLAQILRAVKLFGQVELGNNDISTLPLELALTECYLAGSKPAESKTPPAVKSDNIIKTAAASKNETAAKVQPPVKPEPSIIIVPAAKPEPAVNPESTAKHESAAKPEPAPKPAVKAESATRPEPKSVSEPRTSLNPAAAASSSASNSTSASPTLTSEIERLKLNWKQILDESPPNVRKTAAISWLRSGKPVSMEGGTVTLSFAFDIHKSNVEKPENMKVVEKIFNDYLGHNCKVVCILDNKKDHLVNLAKKMGAQVTSVEEK